MCRHGCGKTCCVRLITALVVAIASTDKVLALWQDCSH